LLDDRARARIRWVIKACLLPASAVAHSARVLTSRELTTPKQRLLALGMLFQLRIWRSWDALRIMFAPSGRR